MRHIALISQNIKEAFYLEAAKHRIYKRLLLWANRDWERLHAGQEEVGDIPDYLFITPEGQSFSSQDVGKQHWIILPGSHAFATDKDSEENITYAQKIGTAFNSLAVQAGLQTLVAVGLGGRISREELRGVKYELYEDGAYFHPHVAALVHDFFLPRIRKADGKGGFERYSLEKLKENFNLRFATYSYGGLYLREAANLTAWAMADLGYSAEEIQAAFGQMAALEIAPNYNHDYAKHPIPSYGEIIVASPRDRRLISAASWEEQRRRYWRGEKVQQLDQAGNAWLVWVEGVPRAVEFDVSHKRKDTYWGHKLTDYFATLLDAANGWLALEAFRQFPDVAGIFADFGKSLEKSLRK